MTVTCPNCHHEVNADASFCPGCGKPMGGPRDERDPRLGETIRGVYLVEERIGCGGMGEVYRARHVTLEVPVAIKLLKRALLVDPSLMRRFQREARAASRLRHANIVHVTDFGQTEDGTLFMAMEYVSGRSLARVITDEFPLPISRIVHVGGQILAALAEAHAAGILHRDLKPENVMVERDRSGQDVVKVLDFGIAKIQQPGETGATLTEAGLVCGTPGYMSPEQWGGEDLDVRSDLYSVGVILYQMLTGHLPHEAQTPGEMLRKLFTEPVALPSTRREPGTIPHGLEALVVRTLASDRALRPASAEEMRDALLACAPIETSPKLPAGPPGTQLPTARESGGSATLVLPASPGTMVLPGSVTPSTGTAVLPSAPSDPGVRAQAPSTPNIRTPGAPGTPAPVVATARGRHSAPPWRKALPFGIAAAGVVIATVAVLLLRPRQPVPDAPVAVVVDVSPPSPEPPPPPSAPTPTPIPTSAPEPAPTPTPPSIPTPTPDKTRTFERTAGKRVVDAKRGPKGAGGGKSESGAGRRFEARSKLYAFPMPAARDGMGVLAVNAEPPSGDVVVNGVSYGAPPCELLVPGGVYEVHVTQQGKTMHRSVNVYAGTRELFFAVFEER